MTHALLGPAVVAAAPADGRRAERRSLLGALPAEIRPAVSVVLPATQCASVLAHLFARLPDVDEVVVIDEGSTDDTVETARRLRPGITVIAQHGKGRGEALRAGCAASSGDIVVLLEAGGPADPADLPRLLDALLDGADMAKGTRFTDHGHHHVVGNGPLVHLTNAAFGTSYSDLCFGFYAFWRSALERIVLDHDGVEFDAHVTIRAARAGLVVAEVPCGDVPVLDGRRRHPIGDRMHLLKAILSECTATEHRGMISQDAVVHDLRR